MTLDEGSHMRGFFTGRKRFVLLTMLVLAGVTAVAAYAALPSRTVAPTNVPAAPANRPVPPSTVVVFGTLNVAVQVRGFTASAPGPRSRLTMR